MNNKVISKNLLNLFSFAAAFDPSRPTVPVQDTTHRVRGGRSASAICTIRRRRAAGRRSGSISTASRIVSRPSSSATNARHPATQKDSKAASSSGGAPICASSWSHRLPSAARHRSTTARARSCAAASAPCTRRRRVKVATAAAANSAGGRGLAGRLTRIRLNEMNGLGDTGARLRARRASPAGHPLGHH